MACGGPAVPTWNYADVHAYGAVRRIDDPEWLRSILRRLTQRHEAGNERPWRMEEQPTTYMAGMLKGIVGFEIRVTRLEGKFKLSQNRPPQDRASVLAAMEQGGAGERAVAEWMRRLGIGVA